MHKLQERHREHETKVGERFTLIMAGLEPLFEKSLSKANSHLQRRWIGAQKESWKSIPKIPSQVDETSCILTLRNSGDELARILSEPLQYQRPNLSPFHGHVRASLGLWGMKSLRFESEVCEAAYLKLQEFEEWVEEDLPSVRKEWTTDDDICAALANEIGDYYASASKLYAGNAELSSLMILTILDVWVELDKLATELYTLLQEFEPGISVNMLSALQLSRLQDMRRLHTIETYLDHRSQACKLKNPSIFEGIEPGCFAERYFCQSSQMLELKESIDVQAEARRESKKAEWTSLNEKYENLMQQSESHICVQKISDRPPYRTVHDYQKCQKCYLRRCARRVEISPIEHPLPADSTKAKAAVFELRCPAGFRVWRDCTWSIICDIGHREHNRGRPPRVVLQDYSGLTYYARGVVGRVVLASRTKPHSQSHYNAKLKFPVGFESVYLTNAMKLEIFDQERALWMADFRVAPSLRRHCPLNLPPDTPYSGMQEILATTNHTNNEAIATQDQCPAIPLHEYLALRDLRSGVSLQWEKLLRELASTNINFSAEAVAVLIDRLTLEVGPRLPKNVLRVAHRSIGRHYGYQKSLLQQIEIRLDAVSGNWKEIHCMKIIIRLLRKVFSVSEYIEMRLLAKKMLLRARQSIMVWVKDLRNELNKAKDFSQADHWSRDILQAAIACRDTFALESEDEREALTHDEATCFLQCGFALQDNLPTDLHKLPEHLRHVIVLDLKLAFRLEKRIRDVIMHCSLPLENAVNENWPHSFSNVSRKYSSWELVNSSDGNWIKAFVLDKTEQQSMTVEVNILTGKMFVDRRRIGRLPQEYTTKPIFQCLFPSQAYQSRPSDMVGMKYMLANTISDHYIHFGDREGEPFVRAVYKGRVLEYIPQSVFGTGWNQDLPVPLIEHCVHWLDIKAGMVEIRSAKSPFEISQNDWRINVRTMLGLRVGMGTLMDLKSPVVAAVASIIEPFEHRNQMLIFWSNREHLLWVVLPRFKLRFFVNQSGLLQCPELKAVIDPDSDCGTMYGLRSKLLLRDVLTERDRTLVVPIGSVAVQSTSEHVSVTIGLPKDRIMYARYPLNPMLQRLDSQPDTIKVYFKAYLHAVTSYVLPDPLTGCTGTEEALRCLLSGVAEPWKPLEKKATEILSLIQRLTPLRSYYPEGRKMMQSVKWNENLRASAQHCDFGAIAASHFSSSSLLQTFEPDAHNSTEQEKPDSRHLWQRAKARIARYGIQIHSQSKNDSKNDSRVQDSLYNGRVSKTFEATRARVYEVTSLVAQWSTNVDVSKDLMSNFDNVPLIDGFEDAFEPTILDKMLQLDVASAWGRLFKLCSEASYDKDRVKLAFLFAAIAHGRNANMDLLRTLVACATIADAKAVPKPRWFPFERFLAGEIPKTHHVAKLIDFARLPYRPDNGLIGRRNLTYGERLQLQEQEQKHKAETLEDARVLANQLVQQWPCERPSFEHASRDLRIDFWADFVNLKLEWLRQFKNMELAIHFRAVQRAIEPCSTGKRILPPPLKANEGTNVCTPYSFLRVPDLCHLVDLVQPSPVFEEQCYASSLLESVKKDCEHGVPTVQAIENSNKQWKGSDEVTELRAIVKRVASSRDSVRRIYGENLLASTEALRLHLCMQKKVVDITGNEESHADISVAHQDFKKLHNALVSQLQDDSRFKWLNYGDLWPRLTVPSLLATIASANPIPNQGHFFRAAVKLGLSITDVQRCYRIEASISKNNKMEIEAQIANRGHENWNPEDYPDWLLLELESNILIRPEQYQIAKEMISPSSGDNSAVQLNMGKGKSSVIVPMVVAKLADSQNLVRVILPRPLLKQGAYILQQRL